MKAGGLALASSISGFILFGLNYRLYRRTSGEAIFWDKKLIWLLLSIIAFTIIIGLAKYALSHYGLVTL